MTRRPARPRLYFSFRSPYSWMSLHRLLDEIPDLFETFEVFPYWDPDERTAQALAALGGELPYQQMSRPKHRYVLVDTKRLATRLGLALTWPIDRDPWWELPHLGWLAARRTGDVLACYQALSTARWTRGLDICLPEVFQSVLDQAGLDGAALLAAVEREDIRAEGLQCLLAAYEDDVFGVPYLRLGSGRYWGFDRVELFLHDRRAVTEPIPVPIPAGLPAYDTDTAGGCG